MKFIIAFFFLCNALMVSSSPTLNEERDHAAWLAYKNKHKKTYPTHEDPQRKANFQASLATVAAINSNPDSGFTAEINHLSDLHPEEYSGMLGFRSPSTGDRSMGNLENFDRATTTTTIPASVTIF